MILRIGYPPQLVPVLRRKKEIERQVQENRLKQKQLKQEEKELIMQQAVMDAYIKNPEQFKRFSERIKKIT